MTLAVRRVDPRAHADGIRRLFTAHERPEFPAWFDAAYPAIVAHGGASWIGIDEGGVVQAHVAGWPTPFRLGDATGRAALLCNLMVATEHRSFLPALSLVRCAVRDLVGDGADLVFTNPRNDGAAAVLRGAGLTEVGGMVRLVAPVGHARLLLDAGVGSALALRRRVRRGTCAVEACAVDVVQPFLVGVDETERAEVRFARHAETVALRSVGLPVGVDQGWLARSSSGGVVGAAWVRVARDERVAHLHAVRADSAVDVAELLVQLEGSMRRLGVRRLECWAMAGGGREASLRRAGFVRRRERVPVMARGYTALGSRAVGLLGTASLEGVDLD